MWIGGLVISAVTTALLMPVVIRLAAKFRVVDVPSGRSSHVVTTPRGGGLGPALAGVGALVAFGEFDGWLGLSLLAVVGFGVLGGVDDCRRLFVRHRLPMQFMLAIILTVGVADSFRLLVLLMPLYVMAVVNAFNFMDGINGISGMTMGLSGLYFSILGWDLDSTTVVAIGAVLLGGAIGFLPFNAPVAKVFMGDVGSYYAGSLIALGAALSYERGAPIVAAALAPVFIYGVDTAYTLVRRVRRGEVWHLPHREHVYQRLTTGGRGHMATARLVGGFIIASSATGLLALQRGWFAMIAVVLLVIIGGLYVRVPALMEEKVRPRDRSS